MNQPTPSPVIRAEPAEPAVSDAARVDPRELRRCLGSFVTGVTVVTTLADDGSPVGMTVNSFNSVSLDPPLVLWSLRNDAGCAAVFARARRFAINILAEAQIAVSQRFATPGSDRFAGIAWRPGLEGVPLIDGCSAWLDCRTETIYPGGDHQVFIGRVERLENGSRPPLAYGAGGYLVVHPHAPVATEGEGAVASLAAVHAARPLLETLQRETGRTVGLGVWGNHGPTMVWWIEGREPLPLQLRCGMVVPLLGSATGQVFAAFAPREATAALLEAEIAEQARRLAQTSAQTPADTAAPSAVPSAVQKLEQTHAERSAVEACLTQVRRSHRATSRGVVLVGVNDLGVDGISVPVLDGSGAIVLAMTMMGVAGSLDESDPAAAQLQQAAERLSARLGYVKELSDAND